MKIQTSETRPLVLIREARTPGAWGRGRDMAEAAKNIRANGARNGCVAYVCAVDSSGHIDEMGSLVTNDRGPILRGKLHNTGVSGLELFRD